jgi:glutamine amidotransferase
MSKITIIDYGLNNLKSVSRAFEKVGREVDIVTYGGDIGNPDALVLPGIGAFGDAMSELSDREFISEINTHVEAGKPMLGICLGMQLLFSGSEEIEYHRGLDLIPGKVVYFPPADKVEIEDYKIPQVGWNEIRPAADVDNHSWDGTLLAQTEPGTDVYFVHSLYPEPENAEDVLAVSEYGNETFPAVVQHESVIGTQFHPEKSGIDGIDIISAFCEQFDL